MSPSKPWNAKRENVAEPGELAHAQSPGKAIGQANLRELLRLARERGVKGRSTMNKEELEQALGR